MVFCKVGKAVRLCVESWQKNAFFVPQLSPFLYRVFFSVVVMASYAISLRLL